MSYDIFDPVDSETYLSICSLSHNDTCNYYQISLGFTNTRRIIDSEPIDIVVNTSLLSINISGFHLINLDDDTHDIILKNDKIVINRNDYFYEYIKFWTMPINFREFMRTVDVTFDL